jgi:hypothetical protein
VAEKGGISLWLHGHRHGAYCLSDPAVAPFPVLCTGSATQTSMWSYGEYAVEGLQFLVRRRIFDPESGKFRDGPGFELSLRG